MTAENQTPVLLTTKEAAALLRYHVETLRRYRACGKGPVCSKVGGHYRYDLSDLRAWVAESRHEPA